MATNYVYEGKTLEYTNGGSAIAAGDVVVVGQQVCVALDDIANGETGVLATEGVWNLPKVDAADITKGDSVIYDVSAAKFDDNLATPAAGDASACCVAMESKGATTNEKIRVKINVGVCTIT